MSEPSNTKEKQSTSAAAAVSMENAGIQGVSGPAGGLNNKIWVKKSRFGRKGKDYKPIPPPNYEMDTFHSLKEQGFTAGLCKAVMDENSTHFAKRFWIVDNSGSMNLKDGHRIVTTAERKTIAQQVTRWEELTATVIFHSQMVAVLQSPTHFRMLNTTPKDKRRIRGRSPPGTKIELSQIHGAAKKPEKQPEKKLEKKPEEETKRSVAPDEYFDYCRKQAAFMRDKTTKVPPKPVDSFGDDDKNGSTPAKQELGEEKVSQPSNGTNTTAAENADMKAKLEAVSKLLNKPLATDQKASPVPRRSEDMELPDSFGIFSEANKESVNEQIRRARLIMQRAKPQGPTPLAKHVRSVTKEIKGMMPELKKTTKRVIVVIATDGIPTTSKDGCVSPETEKEFVDALRAMEGLPVWLVIRLCTDDKNLKKFYNKLDAEVNLSLEVLDDYFGESAEIRRHNPWLNYTLPMHRCRELGYHNRILDFLDERPLKIEELREFASIMFGDDFEDIPVPELQWQQFQSYLKEKINAEDEQYDTQRKRCVPVLDIAVLQRTYNGLFNRQARKPHKNAKSKSDTDTVISTS